MKPKTDENGNINAEFVENPQDRPIDGLIWKQDAIDALDKRFNDVPMELTTEILLLRRDLRHLAPVKSEILTAQPEMTDEQFKDYCRKRCLSVVTNEFMCEVRKMMPPVQEHGEWEYHSNPTIGINPETAYCSCCGFHVDTTGNIDFDEYNFCPRCGVKMEV